MQLLNIDGSTITVWNNGMAPMMEPSDFRLWGAVNPLTQATSGIWNISSLTDPAFMGRNYGSWTFGQLMSGSYVDIVGPGQVSGLDTQFPFPGCAIAFANGVIQGTFTDPPGLTDLYECTSEGCPYDLSFTVTFSLYIFYMPADDAVGLGTSVYVPVEEFIWNSYGDCSTDNAETWTQADTGSGYYLTEPYPNPFPQW